jgi:glycosyltransferase involved in cell wall biosynthesis
MKLYLVCDTGNSGHGTVGREFMRHLLDEDIQLNVSTHEWGINLHGWELGSPNRQFPDIRLREQLIQTKRINPYCILKTKRDFKNRIHNIDDMPHSNLKARSQDLIVKDFKEKEDINISVGGIQSAEKQPKYAYRITETTQNTTACPDSWKKYNKQTDEIWVPCKWAKDGMLNAFDEDKIKIIPYGVDFVKPTFNDKLHKLNRPNIFVFGTCGRWTNLKAHDILVKAFINEFTEEEPVLLFIKTTVNYQAPLDANMITAAIQKWIADEHILDPPEIGMMTDPLSVSEYWSMLNAFDVYITATRAEAVGISILQGMSLGKPTIATDYSAIKDYLNKNNGFPVEIIDEVPIKQYSNQLYHYGHEYRGKYAMPSQKHLQEQMRKVYEMHKDQPEKLQAIADRGKKTVREMFDWKKHMKTRMERLEEIMDKR